MRIEEESAQINVLVGESSKIAVGVEPEHKIDVIIGDAAKMDCQKAVNYIESGRAELRPLVIRSETAAERAESAAEKAALFASTFIYEQGVASDTWEIEHNLGKKPSVTVVDSAGNVQIPDEVTYNNQNQITITFVGAFAGKAFLN
ncbi:MAG: hypothetical protein IJ830_02710 [Alphaproteobacteria bacterium]|nr:hypothetical protein [Alphaproteobacteria bacterium]